MTKWAEYFKVAQLLIIQHLELTLEKKIILIKITGLFCLWEIHDLLFIKILWQNTPHWIYLSVVIVIKKIARPKSSSTQFEVFVYLTNFYL